jgi:hypothetical protein
MGNFYQDLEYLHYFDRLDEEDKEIVEFSIKYSVTDDLGKISYKKCAELVQKYLYYDLEDKYVEFILNFHKAHKTTEKIHPPRLVFRKMRKANSPDIDISPEEARKFKIEEILKQEDIE